MEPLNLEIVSTRGLTIALHLPYQGADKQSSQPAMLRPIYVPKAADFSTQAVRSIDVGEDGQVLQAAPDLIASHGRFKLHAALDVDGCVLCDRALVIRFCMPGRMRTTSGHLMSPFRQLWQTRVPLRPVH